MGLCATALALEAPTSLTRTSYSPSPRSISLGWTDNSSTEAEFDLEKSADGGATWSIFGTASANATTFSGTLPSNQTMYLFRLRGTDGTVYSPYSNTISVEGTDPATADTDGDGMPDAFELAHGLNPYIDDSYEDIDGDRYPNIVEYVKGTNIADAASKPTADFIVDGTSSNHDNIYSTLQGALNQVTANFQVVQVKSGTYSGTGNINVSISGSHAVLLISQNGAASTIVDGSGTTRLITLGTSAIIDGLTLRNGSADKGGALNIQAGAALLVNCVFSGNQASQYGGAIYQLAGQTLAVHSTFLNNSAAISGHGVYMESGTLTLDKCIVWDSGTGTEIGLSGSASATVIESIVTGSYSGTGNSGADPTLVPDGHLKAGSPAIDRGGMLISSLLDMDGEVRPSGTTSDIGADEWVDSDANGLPNWWQNKYYGHLGNSASGDTDLDGLTNLQEYQGGSDPQNYFSQGPSLMNLTLTVVSGSGQTGDPSTFASLPLTVQLQSGTTLLSYAPLTFTVTGSGLVASGTGGTLSSSLLVRTGSNGQAQVNFKFPATYSTTNTIQATATGGANAAAVNFTESTPPFSQTGLSLWLKADAGVTLVSGTDKVSAWADQSGNVNTGTQSVTGAQPVLVTNAIDGKPAIRFSGSNYLTINDSTSLKPPTVTAIAIVKQNKFSTSLDTVLARDYRNSPTWLPPYVSYAFASRRTASTNWQGSAITTAGSIKQLDVANQYDQGSPQLMSWKFDGSTQAMYRSGQLISSMVTTGTIDYAGGNSKITIGARSSASVGECLNGDVAEVLMYNRALTTAEQQGAEAYLADKYEVYHPNATWPLSYSSEVQGEIAKNQWTKAQADAHVAFEASSPAIPTQGALLWLKADLGITKDGSNRVSTWTDQIFGNTVTQTGTASQPLWTGSLSNGQPGLIFTGSQRLFSGTSQVQLNQDWTIITVGRSDDPNTERYSVNPGGQNINGAGRTLGHIGGKGAFGNWGASVTTGQNLDAQEYGITTAAYVKSGTALTLYQRGAFSGTAIIVTGTTPVAGIYVGDADDGSTPRPWVGSINEVIVYDRVLNSTERQQAEVYLADKYGVYHPNATWPASYSSGVQAEITRNHWSKGQTDAYVAFAASSPAVPAAGLSLWLKADAGVTLSGTKVSAWADQSGNGNTASQATAGIQPIFLSSGIDGKPALRFSGSNFLVMNDSTSLKPSVTTVVTILKQNKLATTYDAFLSRDYRNNGTWNTPQVSYIFNTMRATGNAQGSVMNTAGTLKILEVANQYDQSVPQLMSWKFDGTNQGMYRNGQLIASLATSGTIDYTAAASRVTIGSRSNASPGDYLNADVAEVLMYNRALTTTEQQQVEGYLADRYEVYHPSATWMASYSSEVQGEIAKNQWTKAQADAYVAWEASSPPIPAQGATVWFKADSGVTKDGSNKVSGWTDQVLGRVVSQSGTTAQPVWSGSLLNGQPGMSFTGSQRLYSGTGSAPLTQDWTIITCGRCDDPATERYMINPSGIGIAGSARGVGTISGYGCVANWITVPAAGRSLNPQEPGVSTFAYSKSGSALSIYQRGILSGTTTVTTGTSIVPGLFVGDVSDGTTPRPWIGSIHEIVVYDRLLTSTERQQVEAYLADKYAVYHPNATWPTSYSSDVQIEIAKYRWTKAQADSYVAFAATNPPIPALGMSLWLKADAGVTLSGTKVSAWTDQTGFGNNATQGTAGKQPIWVDNSLGGKPIVRFSGSNYLTLNDNSTLQPATITTLAVFKESNTTAYQTLFSRSYRPDSSWNIPYVSYIADTMGVSSSNYFRSHITVSGTQFQFNSANTYDIALPHIAAWRFDGTSQGIYCDGTSVMSMATSGTIDYSGGTARITIGSRGDTSPGEYLNGDVAEVVVYSRALSASEKAQVEVYFAHKYNLPISIPAPVISPSGGTFSGTVGVTITPALSIAEMRYTLSGLAPTAGSNVYSGTIPLTQSAVVSCAWFLDGKRISPVTSAQFYINDTNGSGLSDAWQMTYFGHLGVDPNDDPTGSGLTNLQKYLYGYDPTKYSSNGSGISDGASFTLGYSGTNYDLDGDGISNADEMTNGTDPLNPDTDHDGVNDNVDWYPNDPTRSAAPATNPSDHTGPVMTLDQPDGVTLTP